MLSDKEQRVLLETRLRNLKRKLSKMLSHADLTDEVQEIQREIACIENKLMDL